jgi:hypothetical protein
VSVPLRAHALKKKNLHLCGSHSGRERAARMELGN